MLIGCDFGRHDHGWVRAFGDNPGAGRLGHRFNLDSFMVSGVATTTRLEAPGFPTVYLPRYLICQSLLNQGRLLFNGASKDRTSYRMMPVKSSTSGWQIISSLSYCPGEFPGRLTVGASRPLHRRDSWNQMKRFQLKINGTSLLSG